MNAKMRAYTLLAENRKKTVKNNTGLIDV